MDEKEQRDCVSKIYAICPQYTELTSIAMGGSYVDPWNEHPRRFEKPREPVRTGCAPLLLLPLCLALAGCLSGLATQKAKVFSDNPTPPDSVTYCCAVKAIFGDETCDAHPVVPQPAWDRAIEACKEGK